MQVHYTQVRKSPHSVYRLWSGEVQVVVYQQLGVHGHWSAAIVVEHLDGPLEVYSWSGYQGSSIQGIGGVPKPTDNDMRVWVAEILTTLSTGTMLNIGASSDVMGLLR